MFSSTYPFAPPSRDFIALCQSQVLLLAQGLKADWSGVYLTQENQEGTQTHLIPIVVYPAAETIWDKNTTSIGLLDVWNKGESQKTLTNIESLVRSKPLRGKTNSQKTQIDDHYGMGPYQLVLPLIHQEIVVGLLVTKRKDYRWQPDELTQVETIARTLAIAHYLDHSQNWYQHQLNQQQIQQEKERDRLDDLFHQLRNPLTALRIFSKLLLKRLLPDDKSRSIVENIVRESEHLQDLIKDFETQQDAIAANEEIITLTTDSISLSEFRSNIPSLPPSKSLTLSSLDIKEILEPLLTSSQTIAQEKGINLTSNLPKHLSLIWGNGPALREVLSNLIDNGIKYTPKGGKVRIRAGLSCVIDEKEYQGIAIEDNGYGIPAADQAHIFERHYRGIQSQGNITGSGLGLAIVRDLINQMQGKIELISPTDKDKKTGTTFIVWLSVVEKDLNIK
ncbi:GAF domain-containing sensor histidine kinase [Aphanothece sacrum]|uniref:histidine kinase n=1 Tax=Aphanothece sacrum FPU1 TaxID=1920663 RepID=A0A401IHK9_APHSA|nr:GAF domain-containing sensor histidine kinase [Aphanothece sacrum]GBF80773.1 two-component sensor histidine kinase [Aphanothece sacrum FPU1]GBF83268.1 two-component sensor histidine kinase [Aphanothece sacrum FPU3]